MYELVYSRQAQKEVAKLKRANLHDKTLDLLKILERNPWQNPPPYEKLRGELKGAYSRRINLQHRLVYEVFEDEKIVGVLRMWSHYE